ncbi:MAG: STING domain-containing protein [Ferruginibacter sp.]
MTTRIFIGSSSEGLKVARYISDVLNKDPLNADPENRIFECVLWNDGKVFAQNESYLDSLLKAASMFDFGILVATKDDWSNVRDKSFQTPRDNVIFEYGLFIGRLGINRAFIIQEREAKLPSDMAGITVAQFTATGNIKKSVSLKNEIEKLRDKILEKIKLQELGLLPSTGLAIGYYNNFITPVCGYLFNTGVVELDGGFYSKFELQIYIPNDLKEDMRMESAYYFKENGFKDCTLGAASGRGIKTVYKADVNDPVKLILCDMPTTLNALYNAIDLYLKKGHIGKSMEQDLIEDRELNNFRLTLQTKLNENNFYKRTVKIIEG